MSKTEFKDGYNQTNPVYRIFCSSKSAVDIALKKFKAVFVYVLDHGMAKDPKFLYLKHNHCKVNVIYHQYHDDDMKNELLNRLASTEKITLCFDSTIKEKIFSKSLRRVQGQVMKEKHQSTGIMHVDWPDFAIATTNYVNEVIFLGLPHADNTAYIVHSLMMNKNPVTVHVLYTSDDVKQVYVKKVFSKL
jgi:thioredoxin reductase